MKWPAWTSTQSVSVASERGIGGRVEVGVKIGSDGSERFRVHFKFTNTSHQVLIEAFDSHFQ